MSPTIATVLPSKSHQIRGRTPQVPPDRKGIQQRLGGMFVGSVTRIEHMGVDPA